MGVFDGPDAYGFPGTLLPRQPSSSVPGGLGAYGFPGAPLPQQSDGGVLGFLATLGVTPYAFAPPVSTAENFGWQGLLPGTFGVSPYASAPPASTAENFGWQGLLPGTFGVAPYASALPPITAENFGWQGLLPGVFPPESPPSSWQRFYDNFIAPIIRAIEPPPCPPQGCTPSGGIRGDIGSGGILAGQ